MESERLLVPDGSAPSSVQPWVERSKGEVFLDALAGVRPGTTRPRFLADAPTLAFIVGFAFLLPNVVVMLDRTDSVAFAMFVLLLGALNVSQAVFDQLRLGRPASRALIAGFGTILKFLIGLGAFVVCSLLLGQPAEGSSLYAAIDAILPDIQWEIAILLLSIPLIAGAAYLVYRAARGFPDDPRDVNIRAAIRAERSARAAATGREAVPILMWTNSRVIP
jgi:hypothetical protein